MSSVDAPLPVDDARQSDDGAVLSNRTTRSSARFWRIKSFCRDRGALTAAVLLAGVIFAAIFAPLISGYSPEEAKNL
jgi:hypothetical protein